MSESSRVLRMVADILAVHLAKSNDRDSIYLIAKEIAEAQQANDPYFDERQFMADATAGRGVAVEAI